MKLVQAPSFLPKQTIMPRLALYITFWNNGYGEDKLEWMLTARSTVPGQPPTTFTYRIALVAPGTDRWIEAHQTPGDPSDHYYGNNNLTLMGALLLSGSDVLDHVDLDTFDAFIKDSEDVTADNPVPGRKSIIPFPRTICRRSCGACG